MKTKLLYLASFMLVLFTACSVEENLDTQSLNEKDVKIKKFLDVFSKSVVNSPSYDKFVEGIRTKSSSDLTSQDISDLEQQFLDEQNEEFIALFNFIVELNLSENELREIITDYINYQNNNLGTKNDSEECELGDNGDAGSSIVALIIKIICEVNSRGND